MESKKKKKKFLKILGQYRIKDEDVENELEDTGEGRVSWDRMRECYGYMYAIKCKIDS